MSIRTLLVSVGLLAILCGAATSQPQPKTPTTPRPPIVDLHPAVFPSVSGASDPVPPTSPPTLPSLRLDFAPPAPPPATPPVIPPPTFVVQPPPAVVVPPAPPPEKTVDQLLTDLERVQAEKAAIEKREQELKVLLRKKLEQQTERINKLGVGPSVAPPPKEKKAECVGRIIIEGNAKISTDKIRELIELQAGQILQPSVLEAARVKLEKYGFLGVTVEVVPGENDSLFKAIRVKVTEPPSATPSTP